MIKTDCHLHTDFSADGKSAMEEQIKASISLGFTEITLTDHVDYHGDGSPFDCQIDYDAYLKVFSALKEKYSGKITVRLGVELGIGSHLADIHKNFVKKYPFEFIIGSVHDIAGCDLWIGDYFTRYDKKTAYSGYFEELKKAAVLTRGSFDVIGHIDYLPRYGRYADNGLYYSEFKEQIDDVLKLLIENGNGLEINTSGFAYGLPHLHPQPDILRAYKRLGGEIITVGSDGHETSAIGRNFKEAEAMLKAAGFTAYTVFRERKPFFIDLE